MGNFEAFSQESSEIKEIDWVQQQVKAELQDLQKESFYTTWEDGKVNYDMDAVKNYLTTIQQKNWSELTSKNSSAWIMAVQIALEKRGIDVGKVDGIFGAGTRAAVRTFQEKNGITADGLPGSQTIAKLLEWEDKKPEWEDKKPEWEDEKPEWEDEKKEWEDKKPEWEDEKKEWEDEKKEWEDEKKEWRDKKTETVAEISEKMDLTKVNVDELKKVYGETIDKNWKGFQEKRKVIEIWGLKFKKWTEGMTGLGYKVGDDPSIMWFGQYVDGALTGKWVMFWDVWDAYQWDFVEGYRTWKGKYSRPDWLIYEWGRKKGDRDGRGVKTRPDWKKFEGHRERSMKKWRGTATYLNGDKFTMNYENDDKWKWDYIFSTGEKIYGEWNYLYAWDRECTKKIYNSKEPLMIKISVWEEDWIIRATSYENTLEFKKDGKKLHLFPETEPPTIISLNDFDKALRAIHLINYAIKMTKDLAKKEGKKFDSFWSNGDSLIIGREKNSIKSFFATTLKKNISQDIGMTAYDLAKYLNANAEAFGLHMI